MSFSAETSSSVGLLSTAFSHSIEAHFIITNVAFGLKALPFVAALFVHIEHEVVALSLFV